MPGRPLRSWRRTRLKMYWQPCTATSALIPPRHWSITRADPNPCWSNPRRSRSCASVSRTRSHLRNPAMFTLWSAHGTRFCDRLSRRGFLKAGTLGIGGLCLADLFRLKAQGAVAAKSSSKAVIMVYLFGGPSHIDTYDLKPDAPAEYRGEFKPIQTNVPGFHICELMPLQAKIADKLALVRNMKFNPDFHDPVELFSGFNKAGTARARRPDLGSVISKLRSSNGPRQLPPYRSE